MVHCYIRTAYSAVCPGMFTDVTARAVIIEADGTDFSDGRFLDYVTDVIDVTGIESGARSRMTYFSFLT